MKVKFFKLNLTTIPVVVGVSGKSGLLKLKTCSLYQENLLLQKFNDMYTQVLKYFFSASDIMEAVRGRFRFYGMNARPTFGSSHSASSAYQKWPTRHSDSVSDFTQARQTSHPFKV